MNSNKNNFDHLNMDLDKLFNNKELDLIDKKFIEIVSKNKVDSKNKIGMNYFIAREISDDDFMSIVLKNIDKKKEEKLNSYLEKYLIKEDKFDQSIKEKAIIDERMEIVTVGHKFSFRKLFFWRYSVSVGISVSIIYYLYNYVVR
ncbi:MAG: hypothetical protein K0Q49_2224 [Haloplasmataceae bacterium]|jgi:hypothetical protein|nr:hypothetical protein [Haloplasmataceae bacterium]